MKINPQYTFDNMGNPLGVFLPIDDWEQVAEKLHLDIPKWQKTLIDSRLSEYQAAPEQTLDWDEIESKLD